MSGAVGFYGKLPGAGDFVRRRLPPDLIDHALATHPSAVLKRRYAANTLYRPAP